MTTATLVLGRSAATRYVTGAVMYFAQGIPQGLLSIAIPAWLASLGVSAGEIASYMAVIVLPWAFKLLSGPFMDRYAFLPMGRRRPWVLGAQLGLTLSFLALAWIDDPANQVGLLMLVGVLINSFAATQDVAVDGMAIDLTPVREQGRLNAFMSFGKAVGWGLTSAVAGIVLVTGGLQVAGLLSALVAGAILVAFVFVIERDGERRLPFSRGEAATTQQAGTSFRDVFGGVNRVLWTRTSIVVMLIMLIDGLIIGYGQALMPIAAVKLFGFTTPQWSQLVAVMGLTGAVLSLALGPVIDRFGSKRTLILTISLLGVHAVLLAQTQHLWTDTTYVRVMLAIWVMMLPVVMVSVIALAMAVCSSRVSATQFAIYMSVSNLGYSAGSKLYGLVAEQSSYVHSWMLLGALVVTMVSVLMFHRHRPEPDEGEGTDKRRHVVSLAGGEGGMFFSGAIRCPKCRADMEEIAWDGVRVDRCESCRGIWFDSGERELLRTREAAKAIDVGDAAEGRRTNLIDRYPCPRCAGPMVRMVDPQQRHIWYESCSACGGSFFDAGEFRDLATRSLSDFVKRFTTPERR